MILTQFPSVAPGFLTKPTQRRLSLPLTAPSASRSPGHSHPLHLRHSPFPPSVCPQPETGRFVHLRPLLRTAKGGLEPTYPVGGLPPVKLACAPLLTCPVARTRQGRRPALPWVSSGICSLAPTLTGKIYQTDAVLGSLVLSPPPLY